MADVLAPPTASALQARQARHLAVLQTLIHRDYLSRADWREALHDLATMTRSALMAHETLVTLFDEEPSAWRAVSSKGELLSYETITRFGSRSVLEQVRTKGEPVLSSAVQRQGLSSESIMDLRLESILAVPLFFRDVTRPNSGRYVGGCVYAHRTYGMEPFTDYDVTLVRDITALAQPSLNLLRYLKKLEGDLQTSAAQLREVRAAAAQNFRLGDFETRDPTFAEQVLGVLQRVSRANKVSLLIQGPSGSGKSYLAQAYHYACPRRQGPFIVLDCAQITSPETLAAELFGYAARSGYANSPLEGRPGKATLADKGTLFIDEVGCLPLELQPRLLRLIQTGRFSPLGSGEERQVDVQIIAATLEPLPSQVQARRFREDLYWRLAEVTVQLPPLSQRLPDIPPLAQRFLEQSRARYGVEYPEGFSPDALQRLVQYDWSRAGNLRGLEFTINRSVLLAPDKTVRLEERHLTFGGGHETRGGGGTWQEPPSLRQESGTSPKESLELADVIAALTRYGSGSRAARALNVSRDALVWRLRRAGLGIKDVLRQEEDGEG